MSLNPTNFFLADLPPEAAITPQLITEACQTLRRNGDRYLAVRSTESIIRTLDSLGQSWLMPDYPFRQKLLELGPAATGFSLPTLTRGLDHFFGQLNARNLEALLTQELGSVERLDRFGSEANPLGTVGLARGPELMAHITAGNIPVPVLMTMVLGLLTRSAQFIKCASGQTLIPLLFAHSLYEAEPKMGACLEIAGWKGGSEALESALFSECDCLTVTGSDQVIEQVRRRVPERVRFLGYGSKVSFGYITREALAAQNPKTIVQRAAQDVIAWNQLGCLSPHLFYVERKGKIVPEHFAQLLAEELERLEEIEPRGQLSTREAAAIASRRSFYEVRAAHSVETMMWASPGSTAWTVIFEEEAQFQGSCLNRFIYVKAVESVDEALHAAGAMREKTSTIGVAATETQIPVLAQRFARWGATRICPLGRMQKPPLTWRHDGRPPLADLVTWTDWERAEP